MKHRITVTKRFSFDASHFIPGHKGKCKNLHGHTWTVEITFLSWVEKSGHYGLDFGDIKTGLQGLIEKLDHSHLNDILPYPSAESIAMYIWEQFEINNLARLEKVKVWESPDSYVTYTGGVL